MANVYFWLFILFCTYMNICTKWLSYYVMYWFGFLLPLYKMFFLPFDNWLISCLRYLLLTMFENWALQIQILTHTTSFISGIFLRTGTMTCSVWASPRLEPLSENQIKKAIIVSCKVSWKDSRLGAVSTSMQQGYLFQEKFDTFFLNYAECKKKRNGLT